MGGKVGEAGKMKLFTVIVWTRTPWERLKQHILFFFYRSRALILQALLLLGLQSDMLHKGEIPKPLPRRGRGGWRDW